MPRSRTRSQDGDHLGWYAGVACAVATATVWLGQREFGGYDGSMLVDTGWRLLQHQRPWLEFPTLLPPFFLLTVGAATRVFGNHWWAFTAGESCLYLLLAAVGAGLVRLGLPAATPTVRGGLLWAYLAAISVPHLVTGHLWHSADTSMLATALLLCYAVRAVAAGEEPRVLGGFEWLGIAVTAALWLGKPNLAGVALAATVLFALGTRRPVAAFLFWLRMTGGGAVVAALLLVPLRVSPAGVLRSYLQVSNRPAMPVLLESFFQTGIVASGHVDTVLSYCFVLGMPVLLLGNLLLHRRSPALLTGVPLVMAGAAVSVAGMMTNWDLRSNDLGPLLFAAAAVTLTVPGEGTARQAAMRVLLLGVLGEALLLAGFNAVHRTRMLSVGWWAGPDYGTLETRRDPYFGRFTARDDFWEVVAAIDRDRAEHPGGSVFFGQRLEFEYARLHLPSPVGLPVWWHAGTAYPVADEPALVQRWRERAFDTVYLFDDGRMPRAMVAQLADYDRVSPAGSPVRIYRRRVAR